MPLRESALKTIHELKICAEFAKSFLKEFIAWNGCYCALLKLLLPFLKSLNWLYRNWFERTIHEITVDITLFSLGLYGIERK